MRKGTLNELLGETKAYFLEKHKKGMNKSASQRKWCPSWTLWTIYGHAETVRVSEPAFDPSHKRM